MAASLHHNRGSAGPVPDRVCPRDAVPEVPSRGGLRNCSQGSL